MLTIDLPVNSPFSSDQGALRSDWTDNKTDLKALRSFLRLTENPACFEAIYDLDEILRQTHLSQTACAYLRAQPEMAALIEERYLTDPPDLDALLTYPIDSLGYIYATHLKAHNFDPVFYRQRDAQDDISYLTLRRSQTHDIHHVITGFGTDLAGEIGLQAFQLAQARSPIAIALIASSLVCNLQDSQALEATMANIHRGWTLGLTAKNLFAQKWEEQWDKSVAQWRTELNIQI